MSKRRRGLSAEEQALWRRAVEGIAPRGRAHHPPQAKPPTPTKAPYPHPTPKRAHNEMSLTLPSRANEKRVRRGKLEIGSSLDLHGHTYVTGHAALLGFLARTHERGDQVVIVVTGMGRGGEGVLKRALPGWLAEPSLRAIVSGYAPAHRSHGGPGAFYVFLRRRVSSR